MKIFKESKRLVEDANTPNVNDISTDKLADIVQDEIADEGKKLTDAEAKQAAQQVKTLGAKMADTSLATENALTKALDKCLNFALDEDEDGWNNLLIVGLPGSGKTAIVNQWGDLRNVKIVFIDAKNRDLPTAISGMPARDTNDPTSVAMLRTTYLNPLDDLRKLNKKTGEVLEDEEPYRGVVLFLDELNRAKGDIRGSVLTLINEHKVANGKNGATRYFDKLLFTVAAINPTEQGASAIDKLDSAEKSRFLKHLDYDSTVSAAKNFFEQYFNTKIKYILDDKDNPNFAKRYIKAVRQKELVLYLLTSVQPVFKFDDREEYQITRREDRNLLCQRTLTDAIKACDGTVKDFIETCEEANFLPKKLDMIKRILNGYKDPDVELPKDAAAPKPESDIEDNPELFDGKINTGSGRDNIFQQSASDVKSTVASAVDSWDDM